jgi:hypothetical protein
MNFHGTELIPLEVHQFPVLYPEQKNLWIPLGHALKGLTDQAT